jgi:hypothetical protein
MAVASLLCHSDDNIDMYALLSSTLNFNLFSKNNSCIGQILMSLGQEWKSLK